MVGNFIWTKFFIAGAEEERRFLSFIIISVLLSLSFEIDSTWSCKCYCTFTFSFLSSLISASFFIMWTWTRFWKHNKVIRVVTFPDHWKSSKTIWTQALSINANKTKVLWVNPADTFHTDNFLTVTLIYGMNKSAD